MQRSPRVRALYITTTAIFASTLMYALLVFIMENNGGLKGPQIRNIGQILPYVFLVIAPVTIGIGQVVAGRVAQQNPSTAALIECAAAESMAVLGLILYLLLHSVQWFTIFMGLSWMAFVLASFNILGYAAMLDRMDQQAGPPS